MKLIRCRDYAQMSRLASRQICHALPFTPTMLLGTATGHSPQGTYAALARTCRTRPTLFSRLRILKLDEWGGAPLTHPQSCESFIRQQLLTPLQITPDRYAGFNSQPTSREKECRRIQTFLKRQGPIDLCVLGLGRNGHIGFNEPADILQPHAHTVQLSMASLAHSMAQTMNRNALFGITLGIADIMHARQIILLVTGPGKRAVVRRFLSGQMTTQLPASLLWAHPQVTCYLDRDSL
jgi:galactosamine-6-phosphate isomerase